MPSTISEWKKKKTNPLSEKIMPICEALEVTPEWLLSGSGVNESGAEESEYYQWICFAKTEKIVQIQIRFIIEKSK